MPLYEYKCKSCDKEFEVLQKINAEPLSGCLYCSGKVEKLISVSSFQLKGSGWYVTDYKNKVPKGDAKANTRTNTGKDKNATIK